MKMHTAVESAPIVPPIGKMREWMRSYLGVKRGNLVQVGYLRFDSYENTWENESGIATYGGITRDGLIKANFGDRSESEIHPQLLLSIRKRSSK